MNNIVQQGEQGGYRARADRSIQSGRVVSANHTTNTAILDVGMVDNSGNPVYMFDVPFSPQTPPQKQDVVPILRTSSSPYSFVIGSGATVGGANSGQIVQAGGAVTSIKKTGETSGQQGDIILDPGANVTITRVGKTFTIAAALSSLSPATTVTDVAASSAVGTSVNYAREDHAHKGVRSLAKHAGTALFGDVTLAEGTNVTLGVVGNEITINSSGGGSGVSVEVSGGAEVGPVPVINFIPGTNMSSITAVLNGTDADVTFNAATQSAGLDIDHGTVAGGHLAPKYNEPTLDFEDTALLPWSIVDDPPNTRVEVSIDTTRIAPASCLLTLCLAFTPAGTGDDVAEIVVPYDPRDGTNALTWGVRRIDFRVQTAGGAPSIKVQKSTGTGAFSASDIGTVTLGSGAYEGHNTTSLGTVGSGDKLRFTVLTLATALNWTIEVLIAL